jgi:prevent-host-death family protein
MTRATVTEAKAQLSRLLRRVKRGERVTIYERGRPVAQLVPAEAESDTTDEPEWLLRAEKEGLIRPPLRRGGVDVERLARSRVKVRGGLLSALLAEREEGR